MPTRKLRHQFRQPSQSAAGFSNFVSDTIGHEDCGQLEESIHSSFVPTHERLPGASPAALSATYRSHPINRLGASDQHTSDESTTYGIGAKLESFLIRASRFCAAPPPCTFIPSDSLDDGAPLLSSAFCTSNVLNSTHYLAAGGERGRREENQNTSPSNKPMNVEVVNWMQRRLAYFFMTPLEKYQAKKRIPYKLFIQLLKVLFITLQLIEFGFSRSSHVAFGENTRLALSHLYLKGWDAQYETLDYPPAAGPYAVYEKQDFFDNIGYALTRFNRTQELAIGAYLMDSDDPCVNLCLTNISGSWNEMATQNLHTDYTYCVTVYPARVPASSLSTTEQIEAFLRSNGLVFDFACMLRFQLHFVLFSPVITHLDWAEDPECFQFNVYITMERLKQSGLMAINLVAPYTGAFCGNLSVEDQFSSMVAKGQSDRTQGIRRFWSDATSSGFGQTVTSVRRVLVIVLDSIVLLLGTLSFVLCVRSVVRGFFMWRDTVIFFDNWFSIHLHNVFSEFIQPWLLVIIVNDVMIVISSLYSLIKMHDLERRSEPIAYVFGISALMVWSGVLRYIGFSYRNSILMRTILNCIPALLRFCVCALIMFFAFSLCGWVVLGPYNLKFRSFMSTLECLFSLLNGDDMFVTFSVIDEKDPIGIYLFSRLFLYVFITLFIYVVLNLFITIIFESYEQVKELQDTQGRSLDTPLWTFILSNRLPASSPQYKMDDQRPDRHQLRAYALGLVVTGGSNENTQSSVASNPVGSTDLGSGQLNLNQKSKESDQAPSPSTSVLAQRTAGSENAVHSKSAFVGSVEEEAQLKRF